jgi:hypothetical protein
MLSATDAASMAHLSQTEAAITWSVMRRVAADAQPLANFRIRQASPTQVLPDTRNFAGTIEAFPPLQQEQTKADITVSQLIKFGSLSADWDGFGAAKPRSESVKAARDFIRALAPESVIPQPALHADGNAILFLRDIASDTYVELEFVGSTVEFFARRGEQEWASEFQIGTALPGALSEIGFSI